MLFILLTFLFRKIHNHLNFSKIKSLKLGGSVTTEYRSFFFSSHWLKLLLHFYSILIFPTSNCPALSLTYSNTWKETIFPYRIIPKSFSPAELCLFWQIFIRTPYYWSNVVNFKNLLLHIRAISFDFTHWDGGIMKFWSLFFIFILQKKQVWVEVCFRDMSVDMYVT